MPICVMCRSKAVDEVCEACKAGIEERKREARERAMTAPPRVIGPKPVPPSLKMYRRGYTVREE